MSSTYAGNPANFPASLTIPSDGDGPIKAADVNTPIEGLADRTATNKAAIEQEAADRDDQVGLLPIWPIAVNTTPEVWEHGAFNPINRRWWALGGTDDIRTSTDGFSWGGSTTITGPEQKTLTVARLALDSSSGDMVAVQRGGGSSPWAYFWDQSFESWSAVSAFPTVDPTDCDVCFDSSNGLFIGVGTGGGCIFATTPDGTTWTTRTSPAVFGATNTHPPSIGTDGAGKSVAAKPKTLVVMFASSTDGTTWADGTSLATSFTCDEVSKPIWLPSLSRWVCFGIESTARTVIMESTDGSTWTVQGYLANASIINPTLIGDLLVAGADYATGYELVFSTDGGRTWKRSRCGLADEPNFSIHDGHRVMTLTGSSKAYLSQGYGTPTEALS